MQSNQTNPNLPRYAPYMRDLLQEANSLLSDAIYSHIFDSSVNTKDEIEGSHYYQLMEEIDALLDKLGRKEPPQLELPFGPA